MAKLGVNIDHVATVRQARRTFEPDPVYAAFIVEKAGAQGITIHLREDRRHIQDRDLRLIKEVAAIPVNLEMGLADEIIEISMETVPAQVTIVPEKREEVTTEGGLDVENAADKLTTVIPRFKEKGIAVSLFIEPSIEVIERSCELGAEYVELHTGSYANATGSAQQHELERIVKAAEHTIELGMGLNAGHGLTYQNVSAIAAIEGMNELNIGHSVISRAVFTGLEEAIREMRCLVEVV